MFKLTQEDLRIAKPLANVFIVSFIAIGVAFGTENFELLGLLQGFFPILAIIVLYYSLKLLTAQERSLMFPFLLIASGKPEVSSSFFNLSKLQFSIHFFAFSLSIKLESFLKFLINSKILMNVSYVSNSRSSYLTKCTGKDL